MTPTTSSDKLTIKIADHNTPKAEEIATFQSICDFYNGTQSFLADLFTPELKGWVTEQIKTDGVPNIYQWWFDTQRETSAEFKTLKVELSTAREHAISEETQRKLLGDMLQAEKLSRSADVAQLKQNRDQLSNLFDEANTALHNAEDTIEEQAAEITRLKALLWDAHERAIK